MILPQHYQLLPASEIPFFKRIAELAADRHVNHLDVPPILLP